MTSLAARTRAAVRDRPFLHLALRAGVVNYTAAARELDVEGETEAIATALRRYADELDSAPAVGADARVSMESGVGPVDGPDALPSGATASLSIAGRAYAPGAGSMTAIVTRGEVGPDLLATVLGRLAIDGVPVEAAGLAGDTLVVVVDRRSGVDALRAVESVVEA